MSNFIKPFFKEERLNSVLVTAVFLFFTSWWAVIYFWFGNQNIPANHAWSTTYLVIAILGSYIGFFIYRQSAGRPAPALPRRLVAFFSTGLLFQALGQAVFSYYAQVLNTEVPYPSLADVFFFGSVILYLFGALLFFTDVIDKRRLNKAIYAAMVWCMLLVLPQIYFLQKENFFAEFSLALQPILDSGYYIFETIFAALALGAGTATWWFKDKKFRSGYIFLASGLLGQFLIDFYFSYAAHFGTWINGGLGDYCYFVAYFTVALGLVQFAEAFIAINILAVLLNSFFFIQFLLSGDANKFFSNGVIFGVSLIISYFLIRRNKEEVAQKEKLVRFDALEEAHRRLVALDQQKSEFLTIAAHHLRTPISIIKNYVAMLKDGDYGPVSASVGAVHDDIGENTERMVKLTDDFLDISNLEHGDTKLNLAAGDLRDVIVDAAGALNLKAKQKGLKLTTQKLSEALFAQFDADKIKDVLLNYLENAFKYTSDGTITVGAEKNGKGIMVTVRDTGIGFNDVDAGEFFEKFQRGKNASQIEVNTSTGLGLYIARKFVEAHGGKVWAKSQGPGKGSEFGFWIPTKITDTD